MDLNVKDSDVGVLETKLPLPLGMKKVAKIESQLTTSASKSSSQSELSEKQRAAAIIKKKSSAAMGLATSPAKSVLMQSFMMYMTGSNLNMMSISVTSMSILNPLKAILGINKQFAKFEDASGKVELQMPKLIFTLLNLVWLAVGLYKMSKMRLLPTTSADWSGRIVWKELMESTSIPPM